MTDFAEIIKLSADVSMTNDEALLKLMTNDEALLKLCQAMILCINEMSEQIFKLQEQLLTTVKVSEQQAHVIQHLTRRMDI